MGEIDLRAGTILMFVDYILRTKVKYAIVKTLVIRRAISDKIYN